VIESNESVAAGTEALYGGAVDEDDIETAVIVAIEEPNTAAGRVDDIVGFRSGDVGGGKADVLGDVFEGWDGR